MASAASSERMAACTRWRSGAAVLASRASDGSASASDAASRSDRSGARGRRDVRLERVDPDGERQVDLVLRGTTGHDDGAPVGRPEPELLQQPGLADPRLAGHDERGRAARPEIVEDAVEDAELCVPTDQRRLGAMAHRATIGPSARRDPLTGARRPVRQRTVKEPFII